MIIWAGVSSNDIGAIVEYYPSLPRPERIIDSVQIPGRNGELIFDSGAFANYVQQYDIIIIAPKGRIAEYANYVAAWLYGPTGYNKLHDSYDPDHYRMAHYSGQTDISTELRRVGRSTVEFTCKPQRFRIDGDATVTFESAGILYNPEKFDALPIITVYGSGSGAISVAGTSVTLSAIDGYVTLDCDLQDAYKGLENKNATISAPTFPTLPPGGSAVSFSGGVTKIEVIPRWWTI